LIITVYRSYLPDICGTLPNLLFNIDLLGTPLSHAFSDAFLWCLRWPGCMFKRQSKTEKSAGMSGFSWL